jgi:protein subunit release factor B
MLLALGPRNFFLLSQPGLILARHISGSGFPVKPPQLKTLECREDMDVARRWVEEFKKESVPKSLVEISFSRSSGPGGQVRSKTMHTDASGLTLRL